MPDEPFDPFEGYPFEIGMYRRDGPDTMFEGALAVAPSLLTIRGRVFVCLCEKELTDTELLATYRRQYGGGEYRSIGARRRELVLKGLVVDTGKRKVNPKTGVNNILWGLTERAKALF